MSTKIKICGITCENDIRILNEFLPDYAGFVFAESRRKIAAGLAGHLGGCLDPRVKKAGVFIDMDIGQLVEISEIAGLEVVQLHGSETREYIDRLRLRLEGKIRIWKAFRISGASSLGDMHKYRADLFLTDAFAKGMQGGSGVQFDWSLLKGNQNIGRIVLAGGLNPDNISKAIAAVRPYGVDVSSGVEKDGRKDRQLVREFIIRAREMEDVEWKE